ncbi:MAG: hypothetical protein P1V97_23660 [Planctomycetota bacterium]|nr:hypothetical protein [Planctomycetota bacterium]
MLGSLPSWKIFDWLFSMSESYLLELYERAFLLQQKRIWALETLRKIEHGQLLAEAPAATKTELVNHLQSHLRVAKECLNKVAENAGFESSAAKLMDPSFVLGFSGKPMTATLETIIEQIDMAEQEAGIHNFASMCRELAVRHEPFFEDVHEKIRKDVEFYQAFQWVGDDSSSVSGSRDATITEDDPEESS